LAPRTGSSRRKVRCTARNGSMFGARRHYGAYRAIRRYLGRVAGAPRGLCIRNGTVREIPDRDGGCGDEALLAFPVGTPVGSRCPNIRFPRRAPTRPCARAKSRCQARTQFGEFASKRRDRSLFFALPVTTTR
jgi:hypothetical protein